MGHIIRQIQILKAIYDLIRRPTRIEKIIELSNLTRAQGGPLKQPAIDYIMSLKGFPELYRANYNPTLLPLSVYETYPEGTLGREFARHMISNKLDVDVFPVSEVRSPENYVVERVRRTHDVWHVLTGFEASVAGEMGIQAFMLAQTRSPFSTLLIAGGILHSLSFGPAVYNDVIEQIFAGHRMGMASQLYLTVKVEERMHENLDKLRAEINLVPFRNLSPQQSLYSA